jgi:hypothetical protein
MGHSYRLDQAPVTSTQKQRTCISPRGAREGVSELKTSSHSYKQAKLIHLTCIRLLRVAVVW